MATGLGLEILYVKQLYMPGWEADAGTAFAGVRAAGWFMSEGSTHWDTLPACVYATRPAGGVHVSQRSGQRWLYSACTHKHSMPFQLLLGILVYVSQPYAIGCLGIRRLYES